MAQHLLQFLRAIHRISLGKGYICFQELVAVGSIELPVHFADFLVGVPNDLRVPSDLGIELLDLLWTVVGFLGEYLMVQPDIFLRDGQTFLPLQISIFEALLPGDLLLTEGPVGARPPVDVDERLHQLLVGL